MLSVVGLMAAVVALGVIAARSVLRLDANWDALMYHLPFAALRGGMDIPYTLSERMASIFEGFPALPHLLQGLLWRASGSINATGVINILAFGAFLAYAQLTLRVSFWLVALISLTAPLVLIHASTNYVDLFGNALLAIGTASCLFLWLFPTRASGSVLVGGLIGVAGAAWSKFQLAPVAAVVFVLLALVAWRASRDGGLGFSRRQVLLVLVLAGAFASLPYLKNAALYGNPFWPVRLPVLGDLVPYAWDAGAETARQRPAHLAGVPQPVVFARSLFELDNPTSYPNRARWIIDQGAAREGFRMGGFWGVGVVAALVAFGALLVRFAGRRGIVALGAFLGLLAFVAFLPQSHELRYYLWIPLTWAVGIAMLLPRLWAHSALRAAALLAIVLVGFGHMVGENAIHYGLRPAGYADAAVRWNAPSYWALLEPGRVTCAVGMEPIGFLLTGPTMRDFWIVDRLEGESCPAGAPILTFEGLEP